MKVTFPENLPFVQLVKWAAEHGYVVEKVGHESAIFREADTSNVTPLNIKRGSTIKNHPTFDGPNAA